MEQPGVRILLLGSGGREHAIGWKLAQSASVTEVASAPGNPGLEEIGPTFPDLNILEPGAVREAAMGFDLVVVGPEGPLAAGVVDGANGSGVPVFGPTKAAARLESSKAFAKEALGRAGVPTADYGEFTSRHEAHRHLASVTPPYVVKADGLAAGKGVLVTNESAEAAGWIDRCFDGHFGEAGSRVIIEEHLAGEEISVFAICSGVDAVPLVPARDYKRLLDADAGPNTGGMGSFSPVDGLDDDFIEDAVDRFIKPVLGDMTARGTPYQGFLYAGLVLTDEGPKVLEYNCRLGDPETQVVLPRLQSDLAGLIGEAMEGGLGGRTPEWSGDGAVDVVLASAGYPERSSTGVPIEGVKAAVDVSGALVFHAGTAFRDGALVTAGGRVMNVVGTGPDIASARACAYEAASEIHFPGMQHRNDIAGRAR